MSPPPPTYFPTDQLTGLPAFAPFNEAFSELCREQKGHIVLCVVDVDCFMALMNAEGWFVGDCVLLELAEVVKRHAPVPACSMRQGDSFLFAMLAPHTAGLESAGEGLLSELHAVLDKASSPDTLEQLRLARRERFTATVALVSAGLPGPLTFERMTEAAGKAMFEAKRAGGGRVAIARL